ncbi:MAG: DUF433 domain-containing protein [Cyanobacteria bacterium J06634_5]
MSTKTEFKVTVTPLRWDEAGGIRVGESRVTLDSLLAAYHNGATPEEISVQYSVLALADIYAVITYYLNHMQQIDNYLAARRKQAQQQRQALSQSDNLDDLRELLLARRQSQVSHS